MIVQCLAQYFIVPREKKASREVVGTKVVIVLAVVYHQLPSTLLINLIYAYYIPTRLSLRNNLATDKKKTFDWPKPYLT